MTRTLATMTMTAFALFVGGCANISGQTDADWQAADSGQISQASYATGDTIGSSASNQDHVRTPTPSQPYSLESGDRVRISVYGEPDLSTSYLIDKQGNITLPLIGAVKAGGRNTVRLSRAISNRLGATYIREPHVTVNIDQYRPFYILGGVRKSGRYPYVTGMTVEAAVATAGGYTGNANEYAMRLTRHIGGTSAVVEVPPDFVILPGDSIYVGEGFVWSLGN